MALAKTPKSPKTTVLVVPIVEFNGTDSFIAVELLFKTGCTVAAMFLVYLLDERKICAA